jgi:hypothetical protein
MQQTVVHSNNGDTPCAGKSGLVASLTTAIYSCGSIVAQLKRNNSRSETENTMTDKTKALNELLAKVEAGEWDNVRAFRAFDGKNLTIISYAWHGSVDAFIKLMEVVLPDWEWSVDRYGNVVLRLIDKKTYKHVRDPVYTKNPIVARAGLIAIIKALIWEAKL